MRKAKSERKREANPEEAPSKKAILEDEERQTTTIANGRIS